MSNAALVKEINKNMAMVLPDEISADDLQGSLSVYVNQLIQTDFKKLISLLYRIDVSEPKLKHLLKHNPGEDAGKIIAALVIERQLQKLATRTQFSRKNDDDSNEEKW